jgi:GT2 family glycosyltransferase
MNHKQDKVIEVKKRQAPGGAQSRVVDPGVSVIIVNHNSGNLLARCLKSLEQQTVVPEKVIVVDNASTDGSCDTMDAQLDITVIHSQKNIGFAAGNNLALTECHSPFAALLNPDAFPEPDWLERLFSAVKKYPEYAMYGSRQVSAENSALLDGDGDSYYVSGMVWRQGHMQPVPDRVSPWEVFSPCAAAAFYRTEAVRSAGGFDPDFFCYLEDVDLGFRLRLMGHRCLQVPTAIVHHMGSATTGGQHGDFATYHGHRNLVWTYFKNMPVPLFWIFLPLHLGANLISLVIGTLRGQGAVMLRAKRDALSGLPEILRKRRIIQKNRTVTASEILRVIDKNEKRGKKGTDLFF